MTGKNIKNHLSTLLALLLTVVLSAPAAAVDDGFLVRSQYRSDINGQWNAAMVWQFRGEPSRINVFSTGNNEPIATLEYAADGRLTKVEKILANVSGDGKKIISQEVNSTIVVSEGFPVPYDYLDPKNLTAGEIVLKKSAGGMAFAEIFHKNVIPITREKALLGKMVDTEMLNSIHDKPLFIITITKNGALSVSQLWVEGDHWWIYEETPFRKSWRISGFENFSDAVRK